MTEPVLATAENGAVTLTVDESIYSRQAVLRTAYWFTDRCYLFISRESPGRLSVQIKAKPATLEQPNPENLASVAGEFSNALLDYQLRQEIESQTGKIRELLVAKAFAESGLLDDQPPGDAEDPVEARRRIPQPAPHDC